ncbi:toll/interleukin-1 receptor domain-containing protein [Chloroflexota bacterium]
MAHDVFITYSSRDTVIAEAVCAAFESRHIKCWIAPRDVLPGTEWAEAIVDALDESYVLVLVLSSSSNTSPQVLREVGRAANKSIPIIPIRIDDVIPSKSMDFFVSSHHWLDAQTGPLEKHLERLTETAQQILDKEHGLSNRVELAGEKEIPPISIEKPAKAEEVETKAIIWTGVGVIILSGVLGWTVLTVYLVFIGSGKGLEVALDSFRGTLTLSLILMIPGIYCIGRGMTQQLRSKLNDREVSNWWWVFPVVLVFIGGIISWFKLKNVNRPKALRMLTLSILISLIWTIPFFVLGDLNAPSDQIPIGIAVSLHIGLVVLVSGIAVRQLNRKPKINRRKTRSASE